MGGRPRSANATEPVAGAPRAGMAHSTTQTGGPSLKGKGDDTAFCRLVQNILEKADYGGDQIRHTYGIIDKLNKHFWYERLVSIAVKTMEDTERRIAITKGYLESSYNQSIDWSNVFNEISIAVDKNILKLEERNKTIWARNVRNLDGADGSMSHYNDNINYFLIYTDADKPLNGGMYEFDPNNFLWSLYTHLLLGSNAFIHYKLYLPTNPNNSAKVEIPRCGPLMISLPCCVLRHQILPGFEGYKAACAALKPITVLVDQKYAGVRKYGDRKALNVAGYGCHKFVKIATLRCPTYYDLFRKIQQNKDICKKYVCILRILNIADDTIYLQTHVETLKRTKQYRRAILKDRRCYNEEQLGSAINAYEAGREKGVANPERNKAVLIHEKIDRAKEKQLVRNKAVFAAFKNAHNKNAPYSGNYGWSNT